MPQVTVRAELIVDMEEKNEESIERVKELIWATISPDEGNVIWQSLPKGSKVVGLDVTV